MVQLICCKRDSQWLAVMEPPFEGQVLTFLPMVIRCRQALSNVMAEL